MAAEDVKRKRAKERYSDKRSEKRNMGLIDHLGKGIKIKPKSIIFTILKYRNEICTGKRQTKVQKQKG